MTRRTALLTHLAAGAATAAGAKPLACDMKALTPAQRTAHSKQSKLLFSAIREQKELPDGFVFRFDPAAAPFTDVARWIELERRCCPFLRFALEVEGDASWLRLTGPEGVREFLREELKLR